MESAEATAKAATMGAAEKRNFIAMNMTRQPTRASQVDISRRAGWFWWIGGLFGIAGKGWGSATGSIYDGYFAFYSVRTRDYRQHSPLLDRG